MFLLKFLLIFLLKFVLLEQYFDHFNKDLSGFKINITDKSGLRLVNIFNIWIYFITV
ncbi:hypothetical protein [Streptococcus gordonii]|uniref:hypothetical protein n=1 Tax=Streptococcus gordonii TaxID=1302 RepID=UPI0038574E20